MNKYSVLISSLILALVAQNNFAEEPSNELPMYGNEPFTVEQQENNKLLIKDIEKTGMSRAEGAKLAIQRGRDMLKKGDLRTAIKRFNQAWLLNPDDSEVYHAFGSYLAAKGKADEAIAMYRKALELNPGHAMTMCNLARSYKDKALLMAKKDGESKTTEINAYMQEALTLCEKASRLTEIEENLSYIYYQWAILLATKGDFSGAWEKVHQSQSHGGEFIEEEFIQQLSKDMTKPKP